MDEVADCPGDPRTGPGPVTPRANKAACVLPSARQHPGARSFLPSHRPRRKRGRSSDARMSSVLQHHRRTRRGGEKENSRGRPPHLDADADADACNSGSGSHHARRRSSRARMKRPAAARSPFQPRRQRQRLAADTHAASPVGLHMDLRLPSYSVLTVFDECNVLQPQHGDVSPPAAADGTGTHTRARVWHPGQDAAVHVSCGSRLCAVTTACGGVVTWSTNEAAGMHDGGAGGSGSGSGNAMLGRRGPPRLPAYTPGFVGGGGYGGDTMWPTTDQGGGGAQEQQQRQRQRQCDPRRAVRTSCGVRHCLVLAEHGAVFLLTSQGPRQCAVPPDVGHVVDVACGGLDFAVARTSTGHVLMLARWVRALCVWVACVAWPYVVGGGDLLLLLLT